MNALFQFRLDSQSGVPVYRQIIDQVLGGIAASALQPGNQLPTVRQVAVDLAINPKSSPATRPRTGISGCISRAWSSWRSLFITNPGEI